MSGWSEGVEYEREELVACVSHLSQEAIAGKLSDNILNFISVCGCCKRNLSAVAGWWILVRFY